MSANGWVSSAKKVNYVSTCMSYGVKVATVLGALKQKNCRCH